MLYEAIADYEGEPGKHQTTLTAGSRVKVLDKKEHGKGGRKGGRRREGEGEGEGCTKDGRNNPRCEQIVISS